MTAMLIHFNSFLWSSREGVSYTGIWNAVSVDGRYSEFWQHSDGTFDFITAVET